MTYVRASENEANMMAPERPTWEVALEDVHPPKQGLTRALFDAFHMARAQKIIPCGQTLGVSDLSPALQPPKG